ncbi:MULTISPECIES: YceI family protein [Thalassospira]|jgi:polyisoprenoid-binding protein YceI|uniref:Polyisoprenoid-binding protein n=1 Tax=Thalassospira xiamenensis TaxID=220697 RepID=A0A367WWU6_9PROT|nr:MULTISPECIES: YceI family protein [Thalassospira]UKV16169.1 YceI family protein [Thalassospiraceae bacterium SW-3-3]KZB57734.1 polyisoprenoid-binding protein [Thalassospira xiamenensis]MAZ33359.1 polyisoprenoid-binding protein [Thalassospira sp.]MBO9509687.1 polyisoprenoid-binding protein [Thalassospira sp. A3_1]MCK2165843.1 YceI family protein [Thalassospira xiamenensis]
MFTSIKKAGFVLAIAAGLSGAAVSAQAAESYKLDPTHTSVIFIVNHLGFSNFQGRFGGTSGELTLDRENPAASSAIITIDLSKVDTGVEGLDNHMKTADFLNVEQNPTATFKSTSIEMTGDKTATITGDLTLLGQTKPLVLDVTLTGEGDHPMTGDHVLGFGATGTVTRSEYGMNYLVPAVSDEVELQISTEFLQQK